MASPYQRAAIKAAKSNGLPVKIFLRLVNQESGWDPNAKSPVGAQGLTQLMPGTARGLGVSDPFDPIQNLDGGARYLRQQLDHFGSIRLALAAYNAGPGNVENGDWTRIKETTRYVNSILGSSPGTSVSPSGGVSNEHSQPPSNPLILSSADQGVLGDPIASAAFSSLGKIAQGWKPTSTLGDIVAASQAPVASAEPAPQPAPEAAPKTTEKTYTPNSEPIPARYLNSVGPEHPTSGLPGFPARDFMAPAGSPAVAPVSGKVVRLSGHDPSRGPTEGVHGPFGWSVYIQGDDGHEYFLTHMGKRSVKVGQRVKGGQQIGTVGNYAKYGGADHIHMGVR